MKRALLAASALLLAAPLALAASLPFAAVKTPKGSVLTAENGMTLYIYDKDSKGMSDCYGECAEYWPPDMAKAGAAASGPYSLVPRKDGGQQWAYNGMPLYFWKSDTAKGQTSGDGLQGVWHVVPTTATATTTGGSW